MHNHTDSKKSLRRYAIIAVLAVASLALGFFTAQHRQNTAPTSLEAWTTLPTPRPIPNLALTNHFGQPFVASELNPRWSLWFFGFTHCPQICPTALLKLKRLYESLPSEQQAKLQIVFVSVDPKRDDPATMKRYLSGFHQDFLGVSVQPAELEKLANALGVAFAEVQLEGEITLDHSTALYWVNPQGEWDGIITEPADAAQLRQAIIKRLSR